MDSDQLICPFGSKLSQTLLHPFGQHSSYSNRLCVGCEDIDVAVCRDIGEVISHLKQLYLRMEDQGGNSIDYVWYSGQFCGRFWAKCLEANRESWSISCANLRSDFGSSCRFLFQKASRDCLGAKFWARIKSYWIAIERLQQLWCGVQVN